MHWGVVRFPGSLDDRDTEDVLTRVLDQRVSILWHKERTVRGVDCVVLPGGFSYGDYLRAGALARFSPVMEAVVEHAAAGGLVMGLCNGFQILCEAGLLPGALIRNRSLAFVCDRWRLRVDTTATPFTGGCARGEILTLPIKHGEGCYVADATTLRDLEARDQVVVRYVDAAGETSEAGNPNGSLRHIAGVVNEGRNVFGMMPHAEHACERLVGGEDGAKIFRSIAAAVAAAGPRPAGASA